MAIDFGRNHVAAGLGTIYSSGALPAGTFQIRGSLLIPRIAEGSSANSVVIAVVNKNGSPVYTGVAGARGFEVEVSTALNDVITVVLSSANSVDQGLNRIKTTITMSEKV